jgi:molybdenum cofactor biosynthesis enzyme MoaA
MSNRLITDYLKRKILGFTGASRLWRRYADQIEGAQFTEVPPFPRQVIVEVANICNHKCVFCAYTKMTRPSQYIDPTLFKSIAQQAYDLGAREIGLHGGSEPLTCKKLEEHVATCSAIGYEYIYFTTNGSLGSPERFKRLIDNGVHSIKVSVNAGDRETYRKIHGKDDFDKVVENVNFISEYRKTLDRKLYLAISFVETPENRHTLPMLKERFDGVVDEVFHVVATNQSGQMMNQPVAPYRPQTCQIPFNQVNITREGYLRACCNDYQNMLAVDDLNNVSLADAWTGDRFRKLRRKHIEDRLEGTLCHNCIKGCNDKVRPINPDFGDWGQIA